MQRSLKLQRFFVMCCLEVLQWNRCSKNSSQCSWSVASRDLVLRPQALCPAFGKSPKWNAEDAFYLGLRNAWVFPDLLRRSRFVRVWISMHTFLVSTTRKIWQSKLAGTPWHTGHEGISQDFKVHAPTTRRAGKRARLHGPFQACYFYGWSSLNSKLAASWASVAFCETEIVQWGQFSANKTCFGQANVLTRTNILGFILCDDMICIALDSTLVESIHIGLRQMPNNGEQWTIWNQIMFLFAEKGKRGIIL